jgi:4-alpha-glucanotransferase
MTLAKALNDLATRYGILPTYFDLSGAERLTSPDTQKALLRGAGLVLDNDAMIYEAHDAIAAQQDGRILAPEIVVQSGQATRLVCCDVVTWRVTADQQEVCAGQGAVHIPALQSGVYQLAVTTSSTQQTTLLIASPAHLPTVRDITGNTRIWGVNLALYGLRSQHDVGLGTFNDLAQVAQAVASQGASFVGINPVHALGWTNAGTYSPYSPTHRGFLNTAHIALDRIVGFEQTETDPDADTVQYDVHQTYHQMMLKRLFAKFSEQDSAAFDGFCREQGTSLATFALFEALAEIHGPNWHQWPAHLHDSNGAAVAKAERDLRPCIRFHCWLQWLADAQLSDAQKQAKDAGMGLGLYLDLAVGPRRGGAESWCEAATAAHGVSIGAPPDHLSPAGQNWDLTAFALAKLSADGFRGWQRTIGQAMCHAGVFRIDHVLGLNRSFWIPDDGSPGGYIRQPADVLFGLIAIEAERTGTIVIGEDLGLVPPGFREDMSQKGFYGYSVLQYEKDTNGRFRTAHDMRPQSLACFATHDTPTLKGYWQGRDIDWWQKLGWIDAKKAEQARHDRTAEIADLMGSGFEKSSDPVDFDDFRDRVYGVLAHSPAVMVSIQMDDLLGHSEAQNLPGTVLEHPNWQRRYGVTMEHLWALAELVNVSQIMADNGRNLYKVHDEETDNEC